MFSPRGEKSPPQIPRFKNHHPQNPHLKTIRHIKGSQSFRLVKRTMNIIQYLTVGIHTCFRIKKPPQKNRYPRNLRQIFNQKRSYLPAKIHSFKIFLTFLPTTSYEYRKSRIEDFFRPNAQVHPNYRGARFFNRPKNESRTTNHKPRTMNNELRTMNNEQ